MSKPKRQLIHYLSALPGVGKTQFLINQIVSAAASKSHYIFYVSPTFDLIDQTINSPTFGLRSKFLAAGLDPSLIQVLKPTHDRPAAHVLRVFFDGEPGQASISPAKLGSVLLMTHESFLRIPMRPEYKNTILYFDEARKFSSITRERTWVTDQYDFRQWLRTYSSPVMKSLTGEPSEFSLFKIPSDLPLASILKGFTLSLKSRATTSNLRRILSSAANPRLDVYFPTAYLTNPVGGKSAPVFHTIESPSRIFSGFKYVLLAAAYFEDSQMHALLVKDESSIELVNLLDSSEPDLKGHLRILRERTLQIEKRFAACRIYPLTNVSTKISAYRYNTSVLVNASKLPTALKLWKLANVQPKHLQRWNQSRAHGASPGVFNFTPELANALNYVDKHGSTDLFSWYLRISLRVVDSLVRKNLSAGPPLLVINNRFEEEIKPFVIQPGVDNPKAKFIRVSSSCHGINSYKGSNTIAYLSANNPSARTCRLFKTLLGDMYDPDRDYAADTCVQAVTRLSVRDAKSKDNIYIIVPDLGLANLLSRKLRGLATINQTLSTKLNMASITDAVARTDLNLEGISEAKAKSAATIRLRFKVTNPVLLGLRSEISRTAVAISKAKHADNQPKVKELQLRLAKLRAEREDETQRNGIKEK